MTRPATLISGLVLVLAAFLAGLAIGAKVGTKSANVPAGSSNTFQAGWEAAKKKLQESGYVPAMDESIPLTSLNGEAQEVKGNKISLKVASFDPLGDPELEVRIVEVGNDTKIYQLKEKNQEEYQKEMEAYNQKVKQLAENPQTTPPSPPNFLDQKEVGVGDIKAGDQLMVTADNDIRKAKQFTAKEIMVQTGSMAAPVAPTGPPTPSAPAEAPSLPPSEPAAPPVPAPLLPAETQTSEPPAAPAPLPVE